MADAAAVDDTANLAQMPKMYAEASSIDQKKLKYVSKTAVHSTERTYTFVISSVSAM